MTTCLAEPCDVGPVRSRRSAERAGASWATVARRVEELTRADRDGRPFPLELVFPCLDEVRESRGAPVDPRSAELVRALVEILARGVRTAGPASCSGRVLLRTLAVRILTVRAETADDVIRSLRWLLLEWRSRHPQDVSLIDAVLRGRARSGGSSGPGVDPGPVVVRNPWFGDRSSSTGVGAGAIDDRVSVTAELLAVGRRILARTT